LSLNWNQIQRENFNGARELVAWTDHLRRNWPQLQILGKVTDARRGIELGNSLEVEVTLHLGLLSPHDLSVEIYYGPVDSKANFLDRSTIPLQHFSQRGSQAVFKGKIPCHAVGRFGFRIRILPSHPLLSNPYSLGLILWG
jgi:starch phosphorylase